MKHFKNEKNELIITPVFAGGLGNILYQISVCLSLAIDRKGQALFYRQHPEDQKDNRPFGGHDLIVRDNLPTSIEALFPKLSFFEKPYLSGEIKKMGRVVRQENSLKFFRIPHCTGQTILDGYFFDFRYFGHNLSKIIQCLKPSKDVEKHIETNYGHFFEQEVASVHLRLGNAEDNYDVRNIKIEWYEKVFKKLSTTKTYIVCSDNPQKAKNFLNPLNYDFCYIEGEPMYVDLFLMARCNHNVLHNSSLSAWTALLNTNPKKKVFYHDQLFSSIHGEGATPKQWIDPGTIYVVLGKRLARIYNKIKRPKILFQTLKRDLLYRLSGIHYILDHEKKDNLMN